MAFEGAQDGAALQVPELEGLVVRAGEGAAAVGQQRYGGDRAPALRDRAIDDVDAAHPAGEPVQLQRAGRAVADRDDVGALLAGVAPLLGADLGFQRLGRQQQDQILGLGDRLLDLAPPVAAALHRDQVLPQRQALGGQALADLGRGCGAVLAGVGDENARLAGHGRLSIEAYRAEVTSIRPCCRGSDALPDPCYHAAMASRRAGGWRRGGWHWCSISTGRWSTASTSMSWLGTTRCWRTGSSCRSGGSIGGSA